jgi:2-polyprenyl-3-methyl-5-hydroxy-6-metoxy-1,4-benzoquinol methylase
LKRVYIHDSWPSSWKDSYSYDLQEIWGEVTSFGYTYAYHNRQKKTLSLLTEVVNSGACVLDIAAAQGNFSLALAEMGYKVTWNDIREELIGYVRLKQSFGEINFAPGNCFELDFPHLFDAVLITEIIEHVAHPDDFLAKTASLVKPGGYVIMTTPNGAYFRNKLPKFSECSDPSIYEQGQFKPNSDGHIFLLRPEEIYSLASAAGLIVDKILLFTNPLTNGHMKTEFLLRVLSSRIIFKIEELSQHFPFALRKKFSISIAVRFRKICLYEGTVDVVSNHF